MSSWISFDFLLSLLIIVMVVGIMNNTYNRHWKQPPSVLLRNCLSLVVKSALIGFRILIQHDNGSRIININRLCNKLICMKETNGSQGWEERDEFSCVLYFRSLCYTLSLHSNYNWVQHIRRVTSWRIYERNLSLFTLGLFMELLNLSNDGSRSEENKVTLGQLTHCVYTM